MFDAPTATIRERKQLIRAVIAEIGITVDPDARLAQLRIIWQGGATTELSMAMTKNSGRVAVADEQTIALAVEHNGLPLVTPSATITVHVHGRRRTSAWNAGSAMCIIGSSKNSIGVSSHRSVIAADRSPR